MPQSTRLLCHSVPAPRTPRIVLEWLTRAATVVTRGHAHAVNAAQEATVARGWTTTRGFSCRVRTVATRMGPSVMLMLMAVMAWIQWRATVTVPVTVRT